MGTLTNTMSALLWIAFHLANRSFVHTAPNWDRECRASLWPGTETYPICGILTFNIGTAQLLSVTMSKTSLKSPLRYPGNR